MPSIHPKLRYGVMNSSNELQCEDHVLAEHENGGQAKIILMLR